MHQRLAQIPEILEHIALCLGPQDLFACIQVSSQWHQTCLPALWHTIDDTTQSWSHILWYIGDPATSNPRFSHLANTPKDSDKNKDRDWLHHIFRKYGCHIRELTIHWPMVLEAASMVSLHSGSGGGLALRSLTLDMRSKPAAPRPQLLPRYYNRPPWTMPPIQVSAPLFPGFIEVDDYEQPQVYGMTPEIQEDCVETGWVLTQHFWNMVCSNLSLRRLVLKDLVEYQWSAKPGRGPLNGPIKLMHLREVHGWGFHDMTGIWRLLRAAPNLEILTVDCYEYRIPNPFPEVNMTLRTLKLDISLSVKSLLTVLGFFPGLSSMSLPIIRHQPSSLVEKLEEFAPIPKPLVASTAPLRLDVMFVSDWDALLQYLPHLTELTYDRPLSESLVTALTTKCPRLQAFRTKNRPRFLDDRTVHDPTNDPTNDLLVSSADLRVLDSIENFIHVDSILQQQQPWACLGLERLSCRIVGLERLIRADQIVANRVLSPGYDKELTAEEALVVEKFKRCRDQHSGIYDRLATMTKMRHLNLGIENRDPATFEDGRRYEVNGVEYVAYKGPMFDTLELSLASGLDRLGALKDLEVIGFECINHRIGRPELEWMAKAWPKLKLMYGLDKERLHGIEHNQERAALREYFQVLRPDVKHESLFEDNI
ncbi:hypothetical protein BGZ81_002925 [Podila clonocystis]|nr:hypothetical protein BGZ81_002925 [Podila clonocystis]